MLISIITVNYNNLNGLKRTMLSVFSQTWKEFEYIVIDGGSTDGSKEFIESKNNTIDYWVSEPDYGIYNAMNKGIKVTKGEYLLFLNSGDHFYSDNALSYFIPYLNNNKDILYGNIAVKAKSEWIKTYPKKLTLQYFINDTLPHPASLIKRVCFGNFLYDENLKIASDWKFFMLGICKKKLSYLYINKTISTFYLDGISSKMPQLVEKERKQVLNDEYLWQMRLKKIKQQIKMKLKSLL